MLRALAVLFMCCALGLAIWAGLSGRTFLMYANLVLLIINAAIYEFLPALASDEKRTYGHGLGHGPRKQ